VYMCLWRMFPLPEKDAEDADDIKQWTGISVAVCSARKGQKRVESLGVSVGDLRSSVMR